MVGEASSQEGFMQQAELYLSNAHKVPIWDRWEFWGLLGGFVIIILVIIWINKSRKKEQMK